MPVPSFFPDLRAVDGSEMTISALRTLAAMLFGAFDVLDEPGRVHRISTKVLRAYVGGGRHAGSDQIRDALAWLGGTKLGVPGSRIGILAILAEAPLIELMNLGDDGRPSLLSGVVEYRFCDATRAAFALVSPSATYFNLELSVLTGTRSVPVARLYMILAQYAGRRDPIFQVRIDDLCDRLGIPTDATYRCEAAFGWSEPNTPPAAGAGESTRSCSRWRLKGSPAPERALDQASRGPSASPRDCPGCCRPSTYSWAICRGTFAFTRTR